MTPASDSSRSDVVHALGNGVRIVVRWFFCVSFCIPTVQPIY
jgi:hypothetical protein